MKDKVNIKLRDFGTRNSAEWSQLSSSMRHAAQQLTEKTCIGAEWTGWFNFPENHGFALLKEIKSYRTSIDFDYDTVVVIGIGGSYLGTRAAADALNSEFMGWKGFESNHTPIIYAGHNLCTSYHNDLLKLLETRNPIVNVISKSGTTTEPSVAFRLIRNFMEKRYGKEQASKRIIATTDNSSGALRELAIKQNYKLFPVPGDMGGRFSVLSAVGLVPLTLAGFDCHKLLSGAHDIFEDFESVVNDPQNPLIQYATARLFAFEKQTSIEVMAYEDPRLRTFIEWWKQLFGESEGKQHKGLFPASLALTTDLHSLGQYLQDGQRTMIETFLSFGTNDQTQELSIPTLSDNSDQLGYLEGKSISEVNRAASKATMLAHTEGGVPTIDLSFTSPMSEFTLGQAFAFFECACALSASALNLNPFDQPGVEAYKRNLFGLMNRPGFEAIGQHLRSSLDK